MSVSAMSGRNCVGVRESGRTGGVWESEVWRYDSSAGDRSWVVDVSGIVLFYRGWRCKEKSGIGALVCC